MLQFEMFHNEPTVAVEPLLPLTKLKTKLTMLVCTVRLYQPTPFTLGNHMNPLEYDEWNSDNSSEYSGIVDAICEHSEFGKFFCRSILVLLGVIFAIAMLYWIISACTN